MSALENAVYTAIEEKILTGVLRPGEPLTEARVSEETGAISVVVHGNLRRHLSPETLGRVLRNELLPHEEVVSEKIRKRTLLFWQGRSKKGEEK